MAASLPREGLRDLIRRLRIAGVWVARLRARRALAHAETELGLLGWEQVDFFDERTTAEVKKIKEFENTQASLLNTSAELSGRKAALDEELAHEKSLHDETQAALAAEREPLAAQLAQAESTRRLKFEAGERFERAIEEITRLERDLEERSDGYLHIESPSIAIRAEAREVSDELGRIQGELKILLADKVNASGEAARLELVITQLKAELQRIDAAANTSRDRLAGATRRLAAELRLLERERKKSSVHMSRLDRKKRRPYRQIGVCLADYGIAPLNQPEFLQRVYTVREREAQLTDTLKELRAACAAADTGVLIAFYLLLAALLLAAFAIARHFLLLARFN